MRVSYKIFFLATFTTIGCLPVQQQSLSQNFRRLRLVGYGAIAATGVIASDGDHIFDTLYKPFIDRAQKAQQVESRIELLTLFNTFARSQNNSAYDPKVTRLIRGFLFE